MHLHTHGRRRKKGVEARKEGRKNTRIETKKKSKDLELTSLGENPAGLSMGSSGMVVCNSVLRQDMVLPLLTIDHPGGFR